MLKSLESGTEIVSIMSKRVAIVNQVGFDGGGITKLGIEYSKLSFDVYFKNIIQPLQFIPDDIGNVQVYTSVAELLNIIDINGYDRIIFLPLALYDKDLESALQSVLQIRASYPHIELCYLFCNRRVMRIKRLLEVCKNNKFSFNHYFSITPDLFNYVKNCTYLNVNAFTFSDTVIKEAHSRKKIIFSAGRVEAVRGTIAYFQSINSEFLTDDFYYIHEGAKYQFTKSGISVTPQLFSLFDMTHSPKTVLPNYKFLNYLEAPAIDKLNIYPSYKIDDALVRWSDYYLGVCCILGSKSACTKNKSLFKTVLTASDPAENKKLNKLALVWNDILEYADIEKITSGVPVLFSSMYSQIIKFTDDRLIYNSFSDIPKKAKLLESQYDDARTKQYEWLINKLNSVNENIIKKFTEEFK